LRASLACAVSLYDDVAAAVHGKKARFSKTWPNLRYRRATGEYAVHRLYFLDGSRACVGNEEIAAAVKGEPIWI